MKSISSLILLLSIVTVSFAQSSKEDQINMALLAAPEQARAGATVHGFDADGKYVVLREGTNDFIVRADDPNRPGFEVVCFNRDLDAFLARGRALRAEGKNFREVLDIREEEAKAGKLKMPNTGSTLHIYAGKDAKYNPATKQIEGASYRYVIYMPDATQASTGLPLKPNGAGHPWLMYPGMKRAHIMISPPKEN